MERQGNSNQSFNKEGSTNANLQETEPAEEHLNQSISSGQMTPSPIIIRIFKFMLKTIYTCYIAYYVGSFTIVFVMGLQKLCLYLTNLLSNCFFSLEGVKAKVSQIRVI